MSLKKDEASTSILGKFGSHFGAGKSEALHDKAKRERKASRTAAERKRRVIDRPLRNVQINTRQTEITKKRLIAAAKQMSNDGPRLSESDIIELAIAEYVKNHGVIV